MTEMPSPCHGNLAMKSVTIENQSSPRVHCNAVHPLPFMECAHCCWLVATGDDHLTEKFPTAKIAKSHDRRQSRLVIPVGVREHGVCTFTPSNWPDACPIYTRKQALNGGIEGAS